MKHLLKSIARRCGLEIRRAAPSPGHAVFYDSMAPDSDLIALRSFADRVARFSASPEQSRAIRDLHLTGILREQQPAEVSRIEIGNAETMRVGIWRKQSRAKDAPFVRMPDADWFSWAKKETIEPKRRKWRVAFIGESVARGYLYDPEFTPAAVLEQMLRAHLGAADIEVVDLAMNSLTMQPLKALIGQSLALSPDVIVVFAGNNWHMPLRDSDIPYVEGSLREHGVPRLKSYIDSAVGHSVRQLTDQVHRLVSGRNVSLIWVVPESNLDDWCDPISPAPLLPRDGNRKWRDLRARASMALEQRDLLVAERLANEMIALDGGTNSVPLRILAACSRCKCELREAKRYLEMSRDAEGWNPAFAYTPRTSVAAQNALRKTAAAHKHLIVDLPAIFSRHLEDSLPNRRLFLDYCHLTAEGINLAMAAIGTAVVQSIVREPVSIEALRSHSASPSGTVEGKASLLAAIHNAHYFQGDEISSYWCERAIRFWPKSAEIMKRFADFQTRRGDTMACRSAIDLFGSRELVTLLRGGRKRLDLSLIDAMARALASTGTDIQSQIAALRAAEHSLRAGAKELTDFYYSSTMLRPSEAGWTSKSFSTNRASHCIYASAFSETSKFVFFGEQARPVGLRLTFRVPDQRGLEGTIRIDVNGAQLTQAPAASTWQTLAITIPGDCVTDGLNEIVIAWPIEGESSDVLLGRAADALLARRAPHLYRVFGEIHSLLAFDESHVASSGVTATSSREASELAAPLGAL